MDLNTMMSLFLYSIFAGICISLLVIVLSSVYFSIGLPTSESKRKEIFSNKHVVITGGSSGIGKSLAIESVRRGANVTIIARDSVKLNSAKEEIRKTCSSSQIVTTLSFDVSDNSKFNELEKSLDEIEKESGPVFMLVNCAGSSVCAKMEDLPIAEYKRMLDLNVIGSVLPTKAVIKGMKNRGSGHIVFVASQAAMLGIFGFSAYCASKFALRGLAEALYMETKPYGVSVTVALPPDTDTPGYAEEEKQKLQETREICQASGLLSPDEVAARLLDDATSGQFYSSVGFEGFIQKTVCVGMAPVTSYCELISQVFLMGIVRLISTFYLMNFEEIVAKYAKRNTSENVSRKSE